MNKQIIEENLELIRTCVDCQFAKLEEWKKQFKQDMMDDLIVTLMEYDTSKIQDAYINNHFNALVTKILINNLYSQTSPFYKKYLKFGLKTDDIEKLIADEDKDI